MGPSVSNVSANIHRQLDTTSQDMPGQNKSLNQLNQRGFFTPVHLDHALQSPKESQNMEWHSCLASGPRNVDHQPGQVGDEGGRLCNGHEAKQLLRKIFASQVLSECDNLPSGESFQFLWDLVVITTNHNPGKLVSNLTQKVNGVPTGGISKLLAMPCRASI